MYDIETELSSKQYNSIDLMKLIMALVVVAIHTEPLVRCENIVVLNLYKSNFRCCGSFLFFIASGFLVFDKVIFCLKTSKSE